MQQIDQVASQKRHVCGFIDFMTSDGEFVWATNQDKLQKWSNTETQPITEIEVPQAAGIPVYAFGAVWTASLSHNAIYKIDAISNQILAVIDTGLADQTGEFSVAASQNAVWIMVSEGRLAKIDPASNQIMAYIQVQPHSYNLSYAANAIWLTNTQNASVQRIDPEFNQVTHTIAVDDQPWFISATEAYVWTLNQTKGTVSKIDTKSCMTIASIQLPEGAQGVGGDIFATEERVWVRTTHLLLIEIDAQSNQILRCIQHTAPAGSGAVMQCGDQLWLTAHDIDTLWLINI